MFRSHSSSMRIITRIQRQKHLFSTIKSEDEQSQQCTENVLEYVHKEKFYDIISDIKGIDLSNFRYSEKTFSREFTTICPPVVACSFKYMGWVIDSYFKVEGEVNERLFSNPTIVEGIKFAPLECMCV